MKMKKLVIAVSLCFFSAVLVFAEPWFGDVDNQQKIYRIDCDEYQQISVLYRLCGLAMPSSSGPWTNGELILMLNQIDFAKLSGDADRKSVV